MGIWQKIKENKDLMRFIETTQKRMNDSEIGTTSVVVAYYLLLSLFPLIIAFGNVLPFLNIDPNTVLTYVREVMPETIYQFIGPAIKDLLTQSSGGLLSISALAALWSASQSINALQIAMNKAYGVDNRKNFLIVRLVSLVVIVLFMVAIGGVTIVLGLGNLILEAIQPIFQFPLQLIDQFQALKWPVTLVALFVILFLIYLIVPNAQLKLKTILPGTIFATVGWMLLSQVFGIYAKYFASRVSGYQIIGSFIVLMLWLNFAATIVILGGIINAVVQEYVLGSQATHRKGPLNRWVEKIKNKISNKKA
ncbi:YihY/virulence factor BrkB family protein [Candidatus Enterococcus courvalinii]|uniref:YihY/virulence factor BrkB family protein n=1 Tax=Candidatus Enterococcus courvalinii TaxID=2815329 RepID=A0ABS3I4J1_9ENTE|nr:YihY/virulence factor BrkB family protein [Enterococcus sp. MSG2901]MBO0482998.1 YihY/virulence factor BrkB family protein [Enterococcus sp. MSG2901]